MKNLDNIISGHRRTVQIKTKAVHDPFNITTHPQISNHQRTTESVRLGASCKLNVNLTQENCTVTCHHTHAVLIPNIPHPSDHAF